MEIVRLIFPEVRQLSRRWVASVSKAAELPKAPGSGVSRPDTRADHKLYVAPVLRARSEAPGQDPLQAMRTDVCALSVADRE